MERRMKFQNSSLTDLAGWPWLRVGSSSGAVRWGSPFLPTGCFRCLTTPWPRFQKNEAEVPGILVT